MDVGQWIARRRSTNEVEMDKRMGIMHVFEA